MKKLFLYVIMAFGFMIASCQGNQNRNADEPRGSEMNDEIGGPEDTYNPDNLQGEENVEGEVIEEDSIYNEYDSTGMQQNQY